MKWTARGRDYLAATILTSTLSTLFDIRITMALGFSMTVMLLISLSLLLAGSRRASIRFNEGTLRGFKTERFDLTVQIKARAARWLERRIVQVKTMETVDGVTQTEGDGVVSLSFRPRYSGRFDRLAAIAEFADPLRLASRTVEFTSAATVLEVIPLSLASPASKPRPHGLSIGDAPAGSPGQGQELYGVDTYQGTSQTRDIMWKRVARSPGQDLYVRIRESNVPETVHIVVLRGVNRGSNPEAWVDLVCEGLGVIGKNLLAMGLRLQITFSSEPATPHYVSAPNELVECMMSFSQSASGLGSLDSLLLNSDLIISGLRELEDPEVARLVATKPCLLTQEEASPAFVGTQAIIFTGRENVVPMLLRAIQR